MLTRNGLTLQDFDFYEIHEAFAAQVLCTLRAWESEEYCRNAPRPRRAAGPHRSGEDQSEWLLAGGGPSVRRHRRAHRRHRGEGTEATRRRALPGLDLHRGRDGRGGDPRALTPRHAVVRTESQPGSFRGSGSRFVACLPADETLVDRIFARGNSIMRSSNPFAHPVTAVAGRPVGLQPVVPAGIRSSRASMAPDADVAQAEGGAASTRAAAAPRCRSGRGRGGSAPPPPSRSLPAPHLHRCAAQVHPHRAGRIPRRRRLQVGPGDRGRGGRAGRFRGQERHRRADS